jgi:hypothetical protein
MVVVVVVVVVVVMVVVVDYGRCAQINHYYLNFQNIFSKNP